MNEPIIAIDKTALYDAKIRQMELLIKEQEAKIQTLTVAVKYEKELRLNAEKRLSEIELEAFGKSSKPVRHRRTKKEMEEMRAAEEGVYSELKSNGIPKAKPAESIRSYDDFKKLQDYFLENNKLRDYAMWTTGVCLGVRASDLCVLKWKNILNDDLSFKEKITMYEKKTNKLQNCKITECVIKTLTMLLNNVHWNIDLDEFIFPNNRKSHITEQYCYLIIHRAAQSIGLEYELGSHSMRKSFANIVLCLDKHTIDMNALTKIQGLLNHSDVKCTMKYLGTLDEMYSSARDVVSDFCLGKSEINRLEVSSTNRTEDIINKLNKIEEMLSE